jgi:hypothetical protein
VGGGAPRAGAVAGGRAAHAATTRPATTTLTRTARG